MPNYARLNADSTVVLATATADSNPGAGWLPLVINAEPEYNKLEQIIIPSYVIGVSDVTQSWTVTAREGSEFPTVAAAVRAAYKEKQDMDYGFIVGPSSGTSAPTVLGGTLTTAATMSFQVTASSTNKWLGTARKRFQTSTTAGNVSGMRTAYGQWYRGSNPGFGGFLFKAHVGMQLNLNGGRQFIGLCSSTGALAGEPSALLNCCGMGYDSTDASTGNWFFIRNNGTGSAVKVDLGTDAARNTTDGFELFMFAPAGGVRLFVRIKNIRTGAVVLEDIYLVKLPVVDTLLAFKAEVSNGAVAAADNIEVAKVFISSHADII
jgi:hypothetical protein